MFDSYTQTLQDQIGQLSKLLGAQPAAQVPPAPMSAANQYDLVTGIDGARDFMQKMLAGTRHIVWDNQDSVFYVLQKDSNGTPQRIQICRFEVQMEPTMEEKYVTREDFNTLVSRLDQLLQAKETKPAKETKGVNSNA